MALKGEPNDYFTCFDLKEVEISEPNEEIDFFLLLLFM